MGSRTQVPDSMLTGVGLGKLTTLDESFQVPAVASRWRGPQEEEGGGSEARAGSAGRQKEASNRPR